MKSTSFALAALCATWVSASPLLPLDKRALETYFELFTVTVTVTGYPPSSTAAAPTIETETESKGGWGGYSGWGGRESGGWSDVSSPASTFTSIPSAPSVPDTSAPSIPDTSTPSIPDTSAPSAPDTSAPFVPDTSAPFPSTSAPSTSEASTPTQSAPATASTSVSSDYQQGILDSHNIHRSNASVPALTWSDQMASIAAQIAASCVYAHDTSTGGGGYGQNIGAGAPPEDIPAMITNQMYNGEIGFYPGYGGEPDMSNFEKWGHYSQIVWKSTTSVGCATQYCPNGLANTGGNVSPYFTVCNYSPPGNFGGEYGANVLQPGNMPTVTL